MTTMFRDFIIIALCILATALTRGFPFVFFGRKQDVSPIIRYLGTYLPSAVMAILIIYCIKDTSFSSLANFAPQFIAIICVVILHTWKKNTLLSILAGTAIYMFLIQVVFI